MFLGLEGGSVTSMPQILTVPAVGSVNPSETMRVVVFPAPLAPNIVKISPELMVRLRSLIARTSPNCLLKPAISSIDHLLHSAGTMLVFRRAR